MSDIHGQEPQPTSLEPNKSNLSSFLAYRPWAIAAFLFFITLVIVPSIGFIFFILTILSFLGSKKAREGMTRFSIFDSRLSSIDQMDGTEFEKFLVPFFENLGYKAQHIGKAGDFGADLILTKDGIRTAVQAKCYSGTVGLDAVREAAAARPHYKAQRAMVVTNSSFTSAAIQLAVSNQVILWDRQHLAQLLDGDMQAPPASTLAKVFASSVIAGTVRFFGFLLIFMAPFLFVSSRGRSSRSRKRR